MFVCCLSEQLTSIWVQKELTIKISAIGRTEGSKGIFLEASKLAGQEGREGYAAAC